MHLARGHYLAQRCKTSFFGLNGGNLMTACFKDWESGRQVVNQEKNNWWSEFEADRVQHKGGWEELTTRLPGCQPSNFE